MLSPFAVLARLLRPSRGVHTSPCGYLWELGAEARRNRSRRVRRYVQALAPVGSASVEPAPLPTAPPVHPCTAPEPTYPAPLVPAPRKPVEDSRHEEFPQTEIVRGPYLAWESAWKKVAA
ncbi:hypothetical protein H4W79_000442 [Nocardiopsis terrae]|uniref:Uncharacterized protein n=1 Tax=Nocardiopsis terrae TaxID=372655 RepID=A0ABR9HB21_9ACTN|nr:hypothetical protein [Nocardiopsis terrae]MBE1456228.1 hypothetical protein [Nocardiopsis terrae]